jgi:hypothetical protein
MMILLNIPNLPLRLPLSILVREKALYVHAKENEFQWIEALYHR